MPPTPPGITHISRKTPDISHLPGPKYKKPVEGDIGTWSHCGKRTPHLEHFHSFAMNEGLYSNILCHGVEEPPRLDTNQRIGYADPMTIQDSKKDAQDFVRQAVGNYLGIRGVHGELDQDQIDRVKQTIDSLNCAVATIEKNPTFIVEIEIDGKSFNVTTDDFKTVNEAADFFVGHSEYCTGLIRDENGKVL